MYLITTYDYETKNYTVIHSEQYLSLAILCVENLLNDYISKKQGDKLINEIYKKGNAPIFRGQYVYYAEKSKKYLKYYVRKINRLYGYLYNTFNIEKCLSICIIRNINYDISDYIETLPNFLQNDKYSTAEQQNIIEKLELNKIYFQDNVLIELLKNKPEFNNENN